MLSSKQKIKYLQNELKQTLNSWNNPPTLPYNDLKQITEKEDYNTVCEFKKDLQYIIDKYNSLEYTRKNIIKDLNTEEYYFNPETQILYITDNPKNHNLKIYKSTGSFMVTDNTPETQLDQYMTTRHNYNSDVYDINIDYNQLPSNLHKPIDNDIILLFQKSMPITKKAILNVDIHSTNTVTPGIYLDSCIYKVGETIINSNTIVHEYCIYCETITLTSDSTLNVVTGENKYWNILIDEKADIYIQETDDTTNTGELKIDTTTGDIKIEVNT